MVAKLIRYAALALASASVAGCSGALFGVANAPTYFSAVQTTHGLAYGSDPRQRLDCYAPRGASGRPVVIFWYGGSWTRGERGNYRFVGTALAERGYVVVVPDYRLYPQVRFPAFVEDAARAVAWVQRHARDCGGDPERIVVMGHSAGAHTAAAVALDRERLRAAGARPEWIRGLIGLSGPYALTPDSKLLHAIFTAPYTPADWQPVRSVSGESPPALLLHGQDDTVVLPAHAHRLRDALAEAGVPVTAELFPGRKHIDTVAAFAWVARHRLPVLERSATFIDRVTNAVQSPAAPPAR